MGPCLSIELLWEELMWSTHNGWIGKSFLTSRIHYKELCPFQPTHLRLMSKSTIF